MQGKKLYRIPKCLSLSTPKYHHHSLKLSDTLQPCTDFNSTYKFTPNQHKKHNNKKNIVNFFANRSNSFPNKRSVSTHKTSSIESKSTILKGKNKCAKPHYLNYEKEFRKMKQLIRSESKKLKIQNKKSIHSLTDVEIQMSNLNKKLEKLKNNQNLKPLIKNIQKNYQAIINYFKINSYNRSHDKNNSSYHKFKDNFKEKLKLDIQSIKKMPILDYHTEFMQNIENFSQSWLLDLEKEKKF